MKRFKFIGRLLAFLVVAVCCSCGRLAGPIYNPENPDPDSVWVSEIVDKKLNPEFETVSEVRLFKANLVEDMKIQEFICTIPDEILDNVVSVCLSRKASITFKDIKNEYELNRAVYDNLPQNAESPSETTTQSSKSIEEKQDGTVMEGQRATAPKEVSFYYRIDTIDGKPTKILIKEEKYESK